MGNEMGNSNVTGVPEQDSPRIGDVNKLTEVSKDSIDETVQEDQLLDLNLDHKAAKEPKAAEEIDNSILQQTCQDREEEEKEMTPVMVNATVQLMEQSPTESGDMKSYEQEEAMVIAAQVEDSIQQFGSEESNACSDIEEGEEDSLMTNGERTELQDSLVADSSTGPTEKIQSGVGMVQMLNGVAVEYGSSSEFVKSQKDEPNEESEKHELEFSETVIRCHKKEGEQDQTDHPNDFDAENESTELDLDEAMESYHEAIDSDMRTVGFEANKKETDIPPETAPDRYYENATVNLEEESKENGKQRLESLPQNGEEKEDKKNATDVKSPEIITEELEDETVIQLTNKEGELDQTEQPIHFDAENESRELDLDEAMESFYLEAIDSEMRTEGFEANKKEIEIPPETAPDRYYENATVNLEEDSKENEEQRLESLPQNGEEKEVEKNATEVKSEFDKSQKDEPNEEPEKQELEFSETVILLHKKEGEQDQTDHPNDFDAENESTELDLDEVMESYHEAIDSDMRTVGFEANKKETDIPPETAPDRYYENATVNLEEESKENGKQRLESLPQNGEEKEDEKNATDVKSPEIITEELEDETVIQLTNKEGELDQTEQPIDFVAENESRELDLDESTESFYLEAIDSKMRTVCFEATKKETEIPPETAPDRYYENATVNLEEDSKENGEQRLESLPQNGEEKEVEKNATEVKSPEIITEELEDETVIQLTNKEGERDQTEQPIDFDAENESRELDLDEAIESFYLEAIDSEMRTVCFEATEKETEIPPETSPDRYYENATVNLEEESKENGERILGSSPQNGEEKEIEKNATEVKSPEILTEELEDESDMIELSGSLTEFVILSPENTSDISGIVTKFPEINEREGGDLQNSSSSLSDSAADIDAEVSEETQNLDIAIEVTEDTDGSAPDYLNEALDDNSSVTEDLERKSEESISAFTDLIMEVEIPANYPPPSLLELCQELEQKIVVMETEKYDNPERVLSDFHEEDQGDTENFEVHRGPDLAEESDQARNSKDQSPEPEAKIDVIQSAGQSNSVMDTEQPETEGSLNTESNQENLETERISFDFQNPVPETRFPDVQSTKANFFSSHIFPQTVAVKTETSGVEGSHPDEDELVTKISIAKTEVLTPKATKKERPEEAVLNEKSSSMSNGSAIKRSDAVKSKPPHLKEDNTVVSSLQRHETAAVNKTVVDDAWESPDKKKIVATSPRVRRKQSKSSLFSSCMCCTTVIQ